MGARKKRFRLLSLVFLFSGLAALVLVSVRILTMPSAQELDLTGDWPPGPGAKWTAWLSVLFLFLASAVARFYQAKGERK